MSCWVTKDNRSSGSEWVITFYFGYSFGNNSGEDRCPSYKGFERVCDTPIHPAEGDDGLIALRS